MTRGRGRTAKGGRRTRSFINGNVVLKVDMTDLKGKMELCRNVLTQPHFEKLMYRTFNEVGKRAKTVIGQETTKDYVVTQQWVKSNIGHYQLSFGGGFPVTCKIPLKSHKGTIGGRFKAYKLQKGVSSSIVRTGRSRLPAKMPDRLGGNPPFLPNNKKGTVAFTRKGKARLPIIRVVGLGVPQMPLNRAAPRVQDALLEKAGDRLERNFLYMFGK